MHLSVLDVNAHKTKYMVMSGDQNAELTYNNSFFEKVKVFRYLRTILASQNPIQEEIKSRLNSGNMCCHWLQKLLSSILLAKIER